MKKQIVAISFGLFCGFFINAASSHASVLTGPVKRVVASSVTSRPCVNCCVGCGYGQCVRNTLADGVRCTMDGDGSCSIWGFCG
jgi:hypothetical protein